MPYRAKTEEYAWAAGLFEGEGCFSFVRQRNGIRLIASVQITDLDVLEDFARVVDMGRITGPYRFKSATGHKPQYRWCCYGEDVESLFLRLAPWLHSRRKARYCELLAERRAYELRKPAIRKEAQRKAWITRKANAA